MYELICCPSICTLVRGFKKMGNSKSSGLTAFRENKLLHEFHTFYDLNKNGKLELEDFNMAREHICKISGWKPGSEKYQKMLTLFRDIWTKLDQMADKDGDGVITSNEWVEMWIAQDRTWRESQPDDAELVQMPEWLEKYAEYKFNLYDRTGDGEIDIDEYEYILTEFGISSKNARTAFTMMSKSHEKRIDLDYFKTLILDYYKSDDVASLGNFINGVLDFEEVPVKK